MERQQALGVPWSHIARHMLGLWAGMPGARRWRQVWSDHRLKAERPAELARLATLARCGGLPTAPEVSDAAPTESLAVY